MNKEVAAMDEDQKTALIDSVAQLVFAKYGYSRPFPAISVSLAGAIKLHSHPDAVEFRDGQAFLVDPSH